MLRAQFSREAILRNVRPIISGIYQRLPADSKYMLYIPQEGKIKTSAVGGFSQKAMHHHPLTSG